MVLVSLGAQPYSIRLLRSLCPRRHQCLRRNGGSGHRIPSGNWEFRAKQLPIRQEFLAAFRGPMASPGSRANMLEADYRRVGIATVQSTAMWYFVIVFSDPR
jgi:hypothetical protein